MAKLKCIIQTGIQRTGHSIRFFSSARFNSTYPQLKYMSQEDRINFAIDELEPKTPEVAHLQGLGYLSGGRATVEKAVTAFKLALELSDGKYWPSSVKLAQIYAELEKYNLAYDVLAAGVTNLHSSIQANDDSLEDLRSMILSNSPSERFQEKILFPQHTNSHYEENLWLSSWKTAYFYSKLGELQKAYKTLILAKDFLEEALRNDKHALEYLRQQLPSQQNDRNESILSRFA